MKGRKGVREKGRKEEEEGKKEKKNLSFMKARDFGAGSPEPRKVPGTYRQTLNKHLLNISNFYLRIHIRPKGEDER